MEKTTLRTIDCYKLENLNNYDKKNSRSQRLSFKSRS
jgi:hypothetical protein